MVIELDVPDFIVKNFEAAHNETIEKVCETAITVFYTIGTLSDDDQAAIMAILDKGKN